MSRFNLTINGKSHTVEAEPDMPVLWVLRDMLGLTGTKYSCGIGQCGSCTIHLDGQARRSCVLAVQDVGTRQITTIEGLATDIRQALLDAWLNERVSQCGYCQPGQIMSASALLLENRQPARDEIRAAMAGNLCRCGTYQRIYRAIQFASKNLAELTGTVNERRER